jgi:hypothetical protein
MYSGNSRRSTLKGAELNFFLGQALLLLHTGMIGNTPGRLCISSSRREYVLSANDAALALLVKAMSIDISRGLAIDYLSFIITGHDIRDQGYSGGTLS